MKALFQISILITGIIVAVICVRTTFSNQKLNYQKVHLSHISKTSDTFNLKNLPHYKFKNRKIERN